MLTTTSSSEREKKVAGSIPCLVVVWLVFAKARKKQSPRLSYAFHVVNCPRDVEIGVVDYPDVATSVHLTKKVTKII